MVAKTFSEQFINSKFCSYAVYHIAGNLEGEIWKIAKFLMIDRLDHAH